jgi:tRNA threonylcarbamoyladenosine biosynthesis protein TsaE
MAKKLISHSVDETLSIAKSFAGELEAGDVVCLKGDLGAGKTHFVKGIADYFNYDMNQVLSPTFTLINEYQADLPIYHFDCYRIENESEALEIGAEEYFFSEGVSLIEWPEKIQGLIPDHAKMVEIRNLNNNLREIIFS